MVMLMIRVVISDDGVRWVIWGFRKRELRFCMGLWALWGCY